MATQCCHLLHESANELVASHFFVRWFLCGFCVVLVLCFCFVCFVVDDDGLLDYVQVLHQFSFVALNQQTASRVNLEINAFAMP